MPKEPKYLDKAEVKARIRDGLKRRRDLGFDPEPITDETAARPDPRGGAFSKRQRKRATELIEIATASLAQRQFADWFEALRSLAMMMKSARFDRLTYQHVCEQIAETAGEICGNPHIAHEAKAELARRSRRVISIPTRGDAANDSLPTPDPEQPARESSERGPTD